MAQREEGKAQRWEVPLRSIPLGTDLEAGGGESQCEHSMGASLRAPTDLEATFTAFVTDDIEVYTQGRTLFEFVPAVIISDVAPKHAMADGCTLRTAYRLRGNLNPVNSFEWRVITVEEGELHPGDEEGWITLAPEEIKAREFSSRLKITALCRVEIRALWQPPIKTPFVTLAAAAADADAPAPAPEAGGEDGEGVAAVEAAVVEEVEAAEVGWSQCNHSMGANLRSRRPRRR